MKRVRPGLIARGQLTWQLVGCRGLLPLSAALGRRLKWDVNGHLAPAVTVALAWPLPVPLSPAPTM